MQDANSTTRQETNERPADENIDAIDRLLRGDEPASESKPDETTEGEQESDAEEVEDGKEVEGKEEEGKPKVDYDLEIEVPIGNGVKITVGALKDFYQEQATKELELIEASMKNTAAINHLKELAAYLGGLPPELVARAEQTREVDIQRERTMLTEAIPEFKTNEGFEKGRDRIMALAAEYGLENDIGSLTSHKALKLVHDFAVLKERVKAASAIKQQKKDLPRAQQKAAAHKLSNSDALIQRAKTTRSEADNLAAISALI